MTTDFPEDFKFEGSFDNLNHLIELLSYKANKVCINFGILLSF